MSKETNRQNSNENTTALHVEPVVVERTFDAPVDRVWKALTTAEALRQWSFDIREFKPEVGFQFEFSAEDKGVTYVHHCRVTEVVPNKRLAYTWRYSGYEGDSLVTFDLVSEGPRTRVKVTHTGLETFPRIPAFARTQFMAGWTDLMSVALKQFVETKSNTGHKG